MIDSQVNLIERIKQRFRRIGLGTRLTVTLLPLVLIPMLIMMGVTYQRSRELLRQQAVDQLTSAAQAQIQVLEEWSSFREQRLQLGTQRSALRESITGLMATPNIESSHPIRIAARSELEQLKAREGSITFVDTLVARISDGLVLASTRPEWENKQLPAVTEGRFQSGSLDTVPIYNDPLIAPDNLAIITTAPLRTSGSQTADAVLIGINIDLRIGALMQEMQIFWERRGVYRVERGQTYMVLAPDVIISLERYGTAPTLETGQDHPVIQSAIDTPSGTVEYSNAVGDLVLGAYEWLPEWNLGVVVELPQSDIFAEINDLAPFIFILLLSVTVLISLIIPLTTGRAIRPLADLTTFAERIAKGQWLHRVQQIRQDEIGRLAVSLNKMADDLSEVYHSLEDRVRERTRQIRTASEVARDAVAIRETDTLLAQVVQLISDRFGFYHAGVFLVDEDSENAVLRAASSKGGKRMLKRGHSLPVGKVGIVGYVTGTGNPRISHEVDTDTYHFANPDLPNTKSELALPLRIGEEIIGALDVQSTEPNDFVEEDILVLQTMADQLAVAIENARLIEEHKQLASRRRKVIDIYFKLAQQLSYSDLLNEIAELIRTGLDYACVTLGLVEGGEVVVRSTSAVKGVSHMNLGEGTPIGRGVLGRTVSTNSPISILGTVLDETTSPALPAADQPLTHCVPLTARGQVIGALAFTSLQTGYSQERDFELLALLASQVAASLDNARLFEETQQSLRQVDTLYRQQTTEAWDELLVSMAAREDEALAEYGSLHSQGDEAPEAISEVPIALRGKILGSLGIQSKETQGLSEEDASILQAVANEVAGALEQVRLLDEIRRRAAHLQTAAEIAKDATGLLDLDILLSRAINLICDRFGLYHVSVYLLDESKHVATIRESAGQANLELKAQGLSFAIEPTSLIGYVMQTGECYVAYDVAKDPYHQANLLLPDTRTELGIPLSIGDQIIGALDVHHTRPHAFTEDDIAVMETLADQLAVAVQNARLFEETLQRAQRDQTVFEITGHIRGREDIDSMLKTAIHETRQALGAKRARIRLVEAISDTTSGEENDAKPE
jgi:GAF domain-containing protein/HAMP domain-containing protein